MKIEVEEEKYDIEILEGKIIEQDPKYQENFKIKEGSTIKVIVSKGQEKVIVPNVIGDKKDEAIEALKELQLQIKFEEENSDDIEKGNITKQSIKEGEEILAGSEITLTVSLGIEQVQVPNLIGKSEADAKALINSSKLKYKATLKTSDSSQANNVIVNQSIVSGGYVDKNTEITITLNEFDETKTGTIIVNLKSLTGGYIEPPDITTITDVDLKITFGADTVYQEVVDKNSTQSVSVSGKGTNEVKVYIDGVLKRTQQFNLNTSTTLNVN